MSYPLQVTNEQLLEAYNRLGSVWKVAPEVGICGQSVWERLKKLGVVDKDRWTKQQLNILRQSYSDNPSNTLHINQLVNIIGKPKTSISGKAKRMGLTTNRYRKRDKIMRLAISKRQKEWHKTHEHPNKAEMQIRVCPACGMFFEAIPSDNRKYCSTKCSYNRTQVYGHQGYAKIGIRADLNNQYFRSRWEANYARYLNYLISIGEPILKWEYEPERFNFSKVRTKPYYYTPDFCIIFTDNHREYHEIKGWDYGNGQKARRRFRKYFPQHRLILRNKVWYSSLFKKGVDKVIPNWEYHNTIIDLKNTNGTIIRRTINKNNMLICKYCGKPFYRPPSQQNGKYCSQQCHHSDCIVTLKCLECNKIYSLLKSIAKKNKGFCCRSCASKYWFKHNPNAPKPQTKCIDCGKRVSRREYTRCQSCQIRYRKEHSKSNISS